jgi:hypothetical protein
MSCEIWRENIERSLDADLPVAEMRLLSAHLAACPACRREQEALRGLIAGLQELPAETPPESDLWPAIEARCSKPRRVPLWATLLAAAAAAALLLVLRPAPGPRPPSSRSLPATTPGVGVATLPLDSGYGDIAGIAALDAARLDLEAAFAERRQTLSPRTTLVVEQNLALLAQSIMTIQEAIAADPGNHRLQGMLVQVKRREVAVLADVTQRSVARGREEMRPREPAGL